MPNFTRDQLLDALLAKAAQGWGRWPGAEQLAAQYRADSSYATAGDRVEALIRWESAKHFKRSVTMGLPGGATGGATLVATFATSAVIQVRLVATIAALYGHDPQSDRVRSAAALLLLGTATSGQASTGAHRTAATVVAAGIKRIPGRTLVKLNMRLGFRFVTKAGTKGVVNLSRLVPVAGALVGGTVDASGCYLVGQAAKRMFAPSGKFSAEHTA
jgi:hypothetical protein